MIYYLGANSSMLMADTAFLGELFAVIVESFFVAINVRSNSARAARHCEREKNYKKPLLLYIFWRKILLRCLPTARTPPPISPKITRDTEAVPYSCCVCLCYGWPYFRYFKPFKTQKCLNKVFSCPLFSSFQD